MRMCTFRGKRKKSQDMTEKSIVVFSTYFSTFDHCCFKTNYLKVTPRVGCISDIF